MEALDKIFPPKESHRYNEGKICLRFTNCRFTNDPTESLTLRKMIIEKKDKITSLLKDKYTDENANYDISDELNGISDSYIFSATCLKDSMIFWGKDYAGTNGIAIGFNNINTFKRVIYLDDFNDRLIENTVNMMYKFYEIDKKAKIDLCTQMPDIAAYLKDTFYPLNEFIDLNSIIFKNKSWEHEAEFRIILTNEGERFYRNPTLHKFAKDSKRDKLLGGNLNPKIECTGNEVKKVCYRLFDKNIINSIMLGPDCRPEYEEVVKFHLITNGYDNISVSRSHAFDLKDRNF